MQALREIQSISTFKPQQGVLLELFELVLKKNIPKDNVKSLFVEKGKNYRLTYNRLKDKLLTGVLTNSFRQLTAIQKQHVNLVKKYAQAKILIQLHQRIGGVKIAEEVIRKAEALGVIEIALALSTDLATHFSTHETASKKYHYYSIKAKHLKQAYDEQFAMQQLYNALQFASKNKKPMVSLFQELKAMETIAKHNHNYKFRLWYHHSINRMADQEGDKALFLANTQAALTFFDTCKTPLPYTTRWLFMINLVPIYIAEKKYALTERTLYTCLDLPTKGSFNWHLTLLFQAIYGFYTNKPAIALQAWTRANSIPQQFESPIITERWEMISAYLALYGKLGKINYPKNFRFYTFLNTIKAKKRDGAQKANLIVLEFLHLLVRGKKKPFIEKTWKINQYLADYFNKRTFKRTKYFLRAIRAVVDANFHVTRTQLHAKKHLKKMRSFDEMIDLNLLEKEIVPYDLLWEEVLGVLARR